MSDGTIAFRELVARMAQETKDDMLCGYVYEVLRGGCDNDAAIEAKIEVLVTAGAVFRPARNPFTEWREKEQQPTYLAGVHTERAA